PATARQDGIPPLAPPGDRRADRRRSGAFRVRQPSGPARPAAGGCAIAGARPCRPAGARPHPSGPPLRPARLSFPRARADRSTPWHRRDLGRTVRRTPGDCLMTDRLDVGDMMPDTALETPDGGTVRASDFRGRKLVVFFYPRDDTPGCTVENKDFSALLPEFEAAGTAVLGVSK